MEITQRTDGSDSLKKHLLRYIGEMKHLICLCVIIFLFAIGCSEKSTLTPEERAAYETEINSWHAERMESLKANDGWLNLVGLFWLEPGNNTFGSGAQNNIVFPVGKIAEYAGHFVVEGNSVRIHVNDGVTITTNGSPVADEIIYHQDSARSKVLESGSLRWNIIRREDKLGIRLRDLESQMLRDFKGVERYPIDVAYNIDAHFEQSDSTKTIAITNVLGQTTDQPCPGTLVFTLDGKTHRLDVLDGGEKDFFLIFADATTGEDTYGGGRYMYVKKPVGTDIVHLDFNKAYNPPCVFTPYATCPLPPKQNELSVEIRAGEKNFSFAAEKVIANK